MIQVIEVSLKINENLNNYKLIKERMDKLVTTSRSDGSKTIYETKFSGDGDLSKIIDYLKTNQSPHVKGYNPITTVSVQSDGEKIKRVMTCPIPNNFEVTLAIGNSPVHVTYDFQYNETMLAVIAVNPSSIHRFFRFTEEMIVEQVAPGKLEFHRTVKIYNFGKKNISSSYQQYDDYYNNHTLAFCVGLLEVSSVHSSPLA